MDNRGPNLGREFVCLFVCLGLVGIAAEGVGALRFRDLGLQLRGYGVSELRLGIRFIFWRSRALGYKQLRHGDSSIMMRVSASMPTPARRCGFKRGRSIYKEVGSVTSAAGILSQ